MGCVEADNEIQYIFASYTVCGKILELDKYEIDLDDGGLFLNIVIGDYFIPNEQKNDYFVVSIYNIVLPWVLNEPFPQAVPIKERLVNEKTIDRYADKTAVSCVPLTALYVEVGVTTK